MHTSVQAGYRAGGSAAARVSVNHPAAPELADRIGEHRARHGGLAMALSTGEPVPEKPIVGRDDARTRSAIASGGVDD
ncbi:MAG: hypothetical protein ACOYD0_10510 [Candidatus Nanopelagicales bacterium]